MLVVFLFVEQKMNVSCGHINQRRPIGPFIFFIDGNIVLHLPNDRELLLVALHVLSWQPNDDPFKESVPSWEGGFSLGKLAMLRLVGFLRWLDLALHSKSIMQVSRANLLPPNRPIVPKGAFINKCLSFPGRIVHFGFEQV